MQALDAYRLLKERGDKPCDHPHLSEEFYLSARTGDWACTTCGEAWPGNDWNKKQPPKSN